MLWGICIFSTEAIYADAVAVSNCKRQQYFLSELIEIELHTIEWLIYYLRVFPHTPKSLQIQHPAALPTSDNMLLLLYSNDATLLAVCVLFCGLCY